MRFVVAGSAQSCGEHARNAPGRGFPACIAQVPCPLTPPSSGHATAGFACRVMPLMSNVRRLMNASAPLDALSLEFFREFARCEYCLKAVGLHEPKRRDPTADWGAFANEVQAVFQ